MTTKVEPRQAARFLCRAAWRCVPCDTPWWATETIQKARDQATNHRLEVHGIVR